MSVAKVRCEMVIHLVRIDVPPAQAEEFSRWQASHVVEAVAAMGRSAIAARARVQGDDGSARFHWFFELPSLSALESYLISRERDDLAQALPAAFPEAKTHLEFGELEGSVRRGVRFGEEPAAAFVVEVAIPLADAPAWAQWYDAEHVPAVLSSGAFVRARRFEIHSDDESMVHQMVVYDAVDLPAIEVYRSEKGGKLGEEHASRFPSAKVSRSVWEWL